MSEYEEFIEIQVILRAAESFSVWITADPVVKYAVRMSVGTVVNSGVRSWVSMSLGKQQIQWVYFE